MSWRRLNVSEFQLSTPKQNMKSLLRFCLSMERKCSLQREIEELVALSAAAEAQQQSVHVDLLAPGPPQAPSQSGLGSLSPWASASC